MPHPTIPRRSASRLQAELRREGFEINLEAGRKYLLKAAQYADAEGLSKSHQCLMGSIAQLDDAKEAAR